MYKCLLKYSVVEYRQIEPYVDYYINASEGFTIVNEDYNFNANSAFGEEFSLIMSYYAGYGQHPEKRSLLL